MITNKDVHRLDVTVDDLGIVQGLQPLTDLHKVLPDDLLWKSLFQLIPFLDKSSQVSIWCIFHDNAQQIACKMQVSSAFDCQASEGQSASYSNALAYRLGKPHDIGPRWGA